VWCRRTAPVSISAAPGGARRGLSLPQPRCRWHPRREEETPLLNRLRLPQKLALLLALLLGALAAASVVGVRGLQQAQAAAAALQSDPAALAAAQAAQLREVVTVLAVLALVALILGLWISRAIQMHVLVPVRSAAASARRIADGDLTTEVEVIGTGEISKMLRALREMVAHLRELVSEAAASARTVAETSAQIAQGHLDLSQRTEEQASTLEETSSSLEELTATVSQNADNARKAAQLAQGASEIARRGGEVVGDVVTTMTGISAASRRIEDIIGVIDGIAFQTNILALNAAVEAARAGDQGRGFAVVAAEVRNLAQRSAAASREIKALIVDSAGKVEAGTRLVDAAGQTMQEIVTAVRQVTDLVAEIATASREQSAGIGQVHAAMGQMEQVVQQNASLVEQATAATESLKERSAALLQLVGRFRVGAARAT